MSSLRERQYRLSHTRHLGLSEELCTDREMSYKWLERDQLLLHMMAQVLVGDTMQPTEAISVFWGYNIVQLDDKPRRQIIVAGQLAIKTLIKGHLRPVVNNSYFNKGRYGPRMQRFVVQPADKPVHIDTAGNLRTSGSTTNQDYASVWLHSELETPTITIQGNCAEEAGVSVVAEWSEGVFVPEQFQPASESVRRPNLRVITN